MDKLPKTYDELIEYIKNRYSTNKAFVAAFIEGDKHTVPFKRELTDHVNYYIRFWNLGGGECDVYMIIDMIADGEDLSYLSPENVTTKGFEVTMEYFTEMAEYTGAELILESFHTMLDTIWFSEFTEKE